MGEKRGRKKVGRDKALSRPVHVRLTIHGRAVLDRMASARVPPVTVSYLVREIIERAVVGVGAP